MLKTLIIISLFLVGCGSQDDIRRDDPRPGSVSDVIGLSDEQNNSETEQLARQFLDVVASGVQRGGVTLTDDARSELTELTRMGAKNLRDRSSDTSKAEDDLRQLAGEIVENASFDERTGKRTASAFTVKNVLRRWCPRYPFC